MTDEATNVIRQNVLERLGKAFDETNKEDMARGLSDISEHREAFLKGFEEANFTAQEAKHFGDNLELYLLKLRYDARFPFDLKPPTTVH